MPACLTNTRETRNIGVLAAPGARDYNGFRRFAGLPAQDGATITNPDAQMPATGSSAAEPDLMEAVDLLTRMLVIPGASGDEGRVQRFIVDTLRRAGLPAAAVHVDRAHRHSPHGGAVGNLIVRLPGSRRGPRRLLAGHIDTVPLCVGSRIVRRGDRLQSADRTRAIGADNRSGAAAVLVAALTILRQRLDHPPLTFLWPVQEEVGLAGTRHVSLRDLGRPRLGFNFDGGAAERLVIGATGAYHMNLAIRGHASHAGTRPEQGVSAIAIASLAIADLQGDGWLGKVVKGRQCGTSNIGGIAGGQATNVVADAVEVTAEVRSHAPGFRARLLRRFQAAFERAARAVRSADGRCGSVRINTRLDYDSFRLGRREPVVGIAVAAAGAVTGRTPALQSVDGGLDANWLTSHGIPTITLGAGQHGAHTVDEYLDLGEYREACRVAVGLATARDG